MSLMHSADGQWHVCCICFEWTSLDALAEDEEGSKIDVCQDCAVREALISKDRWCHVAVPHGEHGVCKGWPR